MARKFEFRLQTLLRVRALREQEAKRKLGAKQHEVAQAQRAIGALVGQIEQRQDVTREVLHRPHLDSGALARERAWTAHLRHMLAEHYQQRQALLTEVGRLREELRLARTQTRVVEKLRERRWEHYREQVAHTEQVETDDLARDMHSRYATGTGDDPLEANESC